MPTSPPTSDPPSPTPAGPDDSRGAVRLALAANVLIALAKLTGGALTGSGAMLSEGAHSAAGTLNELFLLTSLRRSRRPADRQHPFGYGKERFFWSLLAVIGILVAGAGLSVLEAYRSFTNATSGGERYYLINFGILGLALVAEGASLMRAARQLQQEADDAKRGVLTHLRRSSDLSLKTVASEDTAAVVGVLIASAGLGLHAATGHTWWEGVASALIALLLVVVAVALGGQTMDLLIGEAADPELTSAITDFLRTEASGVDEVVDVLTMQLGVDSILLAARVDLASDLDSDQIEQVSNRLDQQIQQRWPIISHVFIDATHLEENVARVGVLTSQVPPI